jgi:hypothetical protein
MDRFDQYVEEGKALIDAHPDRGSIGDSYDDPDDGVTGTEAWTCASDQIASILHGVFGRTPMEDCDVDGLLDHARRCWEGDYEGMGEEPWKPLASA